jgi:hypothetical protein
MPRKIIGVRFQLILKFKEMNLFGDRLKGVLYGTFQRHSSVQIPIKSRMTRDFVLRRVFPPAL